MKKAIVNGRYFVAPSLIGGGGSGLFCGMKPIPKGQHLFIAFARADFSVQMEGVASFEQHFSQLYPNNYVNHSESPNTVNMWLGELYIVKKALRDIMPGEEILSDYKQGMRIIKSKGYDMNNWLFFKK